MTDLLHRSSSSRHFRFLQRVLIAAALLSLVSQAHADALADLQSLPSHLESQQAAFTQTFTPKGFHTAQKESGTVVFGSLPQMRWSYSVPEEKLFVFDGTTSWFFIPAEKQVTIHSVSADERASLPFVLLGDRVKLEQAYTVSTKASMIVLKARAASAAVPLIDVTLGAGGRLMRLDYLDQNGNQTVFDFSNWTPISPKASMFSFEAPAGIQAVTN